MTREFWLSPSSREPGQTVGHPQQKVLGSQELLWTDPGFDGDSAHVGAAALHPVRNSRTRHKPTQ